MFYIVEIRPCTFSSSIHRASVSKTICVMGKARKIVLTKKRNRFSFKCIRFLIILMNKQVIEYQSNIMVNRQRYEINFFKYLKNLKHSFRHTSYRNVFISLKIYHKHLIDVHSLVKLDKKMSNLYKNFHPAELLYNMF